MAKCKEADLRKTFDQFDVDHSGFIEAKELRNVVKQYMGKDKASEEDITKVTESVMKDVDTSGDGRISFDEFKKGFKNQ